MADDTQVTLDTDGGAIVVPETKVETTPTADTSDVKADVTKESTKDTPKDGDDKQVTDREEYLKDTQKEITEARMELAELKGQVNALATQRTEKVEDKPHWTEDESGDEDFNLNPAEATRKMIKRALGDVASFVRDDHDAVIDTMSKKVIEATDPAEQEFRVTLSEIAKAVPGVRNLSKEEQVGMVELYNSRVPDREDVIPPATGPAGSGVKIQVSPEEEATRIANEKEANRRKFFGSGEDKDDTIVSPQMIN